MFNKKPENETSVMDGVLVPDNFRWTPRLQNSFLTETLPDGSSVFRTRPIEDAFARRRRQSSIDEEIL